jgi:hypothetical protein
VRLLVDDQADARAEDLLEFFASALTDCEIACELLLAIDSEDDSIQTWPRKAQSPHGESKRNFHPGLRRRRIARRRRLDWRQDDASVRIPEFKRNAMVLTVALAVSREEKSQSLDRLIKVTDQDLDPIRNNPVETEETDQTAAFLADIFAD